MFTLVAIIDPAGSVNGKKQKVTVINKHAGCLLGQNLLV